ncbi:hypothetical protein SNEBB_006469 [Seison nebaliae]|nr:hypothetical protein SNEBB_006469 [Seison nebaliae]
MSLLILESNEKRTTSSSTSLYKHQQHHHNHHHHHNHNHHQQHHHHRSQQQHCTISNNNNNNSNNNNNNNNKNISYNHQHYRENNNIKNENSFTDNTNNNSKTSNPNSCYNYNQYCLEGYGNIKKNRIFNNYTYHQRELEEQEEETQEGGGELEPEEKFGNHHLNRHYNNCANKNNKQQRKKFTPTHVITTSNSSDNNHYSKTKTNKQKSNKKSRQNSKTSSNSIIHQNNSANGSRRSLLHHLNVQLNTNDHQFHNHQLLRRQSRHSLYHQQSTEDNQIINQNFSNLHHFHDRNNYDYINQFNDVINLESKATQLINKYVGDETLDRLKREKESSTLLSKYLNKKANSHYIPVFPQSTNLTDYVHLSQQELGKRNKKLTDSSSTFMSHNTQGPSDTAKSPKKMTYRTNLLYSETGKLPRDTDRNKMKLPKLRLPPLVTHSSEFDITLERPINNCTTSQIMNCGGEKNSISFEKLSHNCLTKTNSNRRNMSKSMKISQKPLIVQNQIVEKPMNISNDIPFDNNILGSNHIHTVSMIENGTLATRHIRPLMSRMTTSFKKLHRFNLQSLARRSHATIPITPSITTTSTHNTEKILPHEPIHMAKSQIFQRPSTDIQLSDMIPTTTTVILATSTPIIMAVTRTVTTTTTCRSILTTSSRPVFTVANPMKLPTRPPPPNIEEIEVSGRNSERNLYNNRKTKISSNNYISDLKDLNQTNRYRNTIIFSDLYKSDNGVGGGGVVNDQNNKENLRNNNLKNPTKNKKNKMTNFESSNLRQLPTLLQLLRSHRNKSTTCLLKNGMTFSVKKFQRKYRDLEKSSEKMRRFRFSKSQNRTTTNDVRSNSRNEGNIPLASSRKLKNLFKSSTSSTTTLPVNTTTTLATTAAKIGIRKKKNTDNKFKEYNRMTNCSSKYLENRRQLFSLKCIGTNENEKQENDGCEVTDRIDMSSSSSSSNVPMIKHHSYIFGVNGINARKETYEQQLANHGNTNCLSNEMMTESLQLPSSHRQISSITSSFSSYSVSCNSSSSSSSSSPVSASSVSSSTSSPYSSQKDSCTTNFSSNISKRETIEKNFRLPSSAHLLRCLGQYMQKQCGKKYASFDISNFEFPSKSTDLKNLKKSFQSSDNRGIYDKLLNWIITADKRLLQQGWQDVPFFSVASNIVILFAVIRKTIDSMILDNTTAKSILSLKAYILACLYITFSYVGAEISYPLRPFCLPQEDRNITWNRILQIALDSSSIQLHLHQSETAFQKTCNELRSFGD